ncbi:hypothetical protein OE88DRAFT_509577 [Heliocybe sulcata]|uniref:Geranylgeranyl pyrophosphate synthetase n=1 Tax=Heliocybe sulcata TaxID=5364 RepID=A0A5C3MTJ7_9AGAM|nr:hypothetical protein OE88DRAFT_509577 [Heliocybe sulcata]
MVACYPCITAMSFIAQRCTKMFTPAHGYRAPPDREILEGLETQPLKVLRIPAVTGIVHDVQIRDVEYLGSYNWMESGIPTLVVPGSPRLWLDKRLPFSVSPDQGRTSLSDNENHVPGRALVPLLCAVDIVEEKTGKEEKFAWSTVDFVTNRRSLRKLLRWIDGRAKTNFRIDMQLAGSRTVLLSPWEANTSEPVWANYGYTFERVACAAAPGCEKGHTRIISYDFDGLKMVLRSNVNAFLLAPAGEASTSVDSLTRDLSLLGLQASPGISPKDAVLDAVSGLHIVRSGSANISQDSLIEIDTCSEKRRYSLKWPEVYPQMFLSQTSNRYTAIHEDGRFHTVEKRKLGEPYMRKVEERTQPGLRKLRHVLQVIHDLVLEHGETGRLCLVCEKGELKVYKRTTMESFLPDEFLQRFHDNGEGF